jgi:hypothetical protein
MARTLALTTYVRVDDDLTVEQTAQVYDTLRSAQRAAADEIDRLAQASVLTSTITDRR